MLLFGFSGALPCLTGHPEGFFGMSFVWSTGHLETAPLLLVGVAGPGLA